LKRDVPELVDAFIRFSQWWLQIPAAFLDAPTMESSRRSPIITATIRLRRSWPDCEPAADSLSPQQTGGRYAMWRRARAD